MKKMSERKLLDWHLGDIEQRFGFNGGKYTDVNTWFALLASALICGGFFIGLCHVPTSIRTTKAISMILERGWTPYAMVTLFVLAIVILFVKWRKLSFQSKAFKIELIPVGNNFALTSDTALDVIKTLNESVDDPKRFVLFNRHCHFAFFPSSNCFLTAVLIRPYLVAVAISVSRASLPNTACIVFNAVKISSIVPVPLIM
jgi:hypothetical protein